MCGPLLMHTVRLPQPCIGDACERTTRGRATLTSCTVGHCCTRHNTSHSSAKCDEACQHTQPRLSDADCHACVGPCICTHRGYHSRACGMHGSGRQDGGRHSRNSRAPHDVRVSSIRKWHHVTSASQCGQPPLRDMHARAQWARTPPLRCGPHAILPNNASETDCGWSLQNWKLPASSSA